MSPAPPSPRSDEGRKRSDPIVGRRVADRYEVIDLVARGGMARVYRGRDVRLDREVALKILSSPFADAPDQVERFLDEARTAASLSHPNLVHVYDSGTDGGLHIIVMELLSRYRSLRTVVGERGPLPPPEVVAIADDLLAGLELVHERGFVHCDVKSANVMLGPGPTKLIDFGIARTPTAESGAATSIGSLHYMAPEQLHGDRLSPASDLYGVGVVLYEALTGRVPFDGRTPSEIADTQRSGPPPPPSETVDGPDRLDRVVLQALAIEPASRFVSAAAMRRAVASVPPEADAVDGSEDETASFHRPSAGTAPRSGYVPPPVASAPPSERRRPAQRPRPRRRRNWGGLLVALLAIAAIAGILWLVFTLGAGNSFPGGSSQPPSSDGATAPGDGAVTVPDTVGLTFDEGIDAAREAGLDWTVACDTQPDLPEEIYAQEPAAGERVAPGARFTMFFPRFEGYCD